MGAAWRTGRSGARTAGERLGGNTGGSGLDPIWSVIGRSERSRAPSWPGFSSLPGNGRPGTPIPRLHGCPASGSTSPRRSTTSTRTPTSGHAYTTIMADILARHHRQRGEDVFFLTGTDEHGAKIARSAGRGRGRSPQAHADLLAERFRDLGALLGASNDFFVRTTDPATRSACRASSSACASPGTSTGAPTAAGTARPASSSTPRATCWRAARCPVHGTPVEWLEEENWFFRLSAYRDRLLALYDANPDFVRPAAPRQRGPPDDRGRAGGPVGLALPDRLGHPGALGPRAGRLRLGGRALQLLDGARASRGRART